MVQFFDSLCRFTTFTYGLKYAAMCHKIFRQQKCSQQYPVYARNTCTKTNPDRNLQLKQATLWTQTTEMSTFSTQIAQKLNNMKRAYQSLTTQSWGSKLHLHQHQCLQMQSKLTQTVCQLQHFTPSLTAVHGQIHCVAFITEAHGHYHVPQSLCLALNY